MYYYIRLFYLFLTNYVLSLEVGAQSNSFETFTNEVQAGSPKTSTEDDTHLRIVGGRNCSIEEYPFLVSIRTAVSSTHFCGGSLLSYRHVLSAAHCFETFPHKPKFIKVLVGSAYLRSSKGENVGVSRIIMHPNYVIKTAENDIAILELTQNVKTGAAALVKLPKSHLPDDLSTVCDPNDFMVAGWGDERPRGKNDKKNEGKMSPQLKCVYIPYITKKECLKYARNAANDNILCALYPKGGKDACQGDSGGPLVCKGVQYGIISWGKGCASPEFPGFYTRVDRYLDFIDRSVVDLKNSGPVKSFRIVFITLSTIYFIVFYVDPL